MKRLFAPLFLLLLGAQSPDGLLFEAPVVVASFPHDPTAFTEGLFYEKGSLFESTGLEGQSVIRESRLADGKVLREATIDSQYFGEGIVAWKGRIISLTWQHGLGFFWDRKSFKQTGSFRYSGEGWGLTHDGRDIIMSDGTPALRFLDPATLKEKRRLNVTADGHAVPRLNELEYVKGEILANVWLTDRIARIDPATGHVKGWIDLTALARASGRVGSDNVANGIAYDAAKDRLFVTGKNWPLVYQIIVPAMTASAP
ncbi:glutaminyl-peptide cyclotransferase [Sphingobium boeckii]|uniref:Glutaminyl-peptide cyclotransferase n=1 Tax=Sphingobium boeckii TaxID=1082345 RepID=A0A7W9AJH8_9SPHN|nr:glutaminyl-peptide cyclotransferase [Sphingobium boeckii]MBB5686857.1 glutaminyl-peptide cyclotransferase [Sphingobium boeckii]